MQPEQTDAEFFSRLAARTVEELDGALACYYPVEGNNDLPEAMTATYLAFQLRDAGFRVFPQVQCSGRIDNHLDFAAGSVPGEHLLPALLSGFGRQCPHIRGGPATEDHAAVGVILTTTGFH